MIVEGEDATVVAQKCTRLTDGAAFSRGRLLRTCSLCCLHLVPQRFCNGRPNVGRSAGGEVLG